MALPPKELSHPAPRSLSGLRGIRRQLVACYRETKAGMLDQKLAGRLTYILNSLAAIDNGAALEARIEALEQRLDQPAVKPNGGGYYARP